jgi:suppressor of tumorigenicity protein 13
MSLKTPPEVSSAIKKLSASDQGKVVLILKTFQMVSCITNFFSAIVPSSTLHCAPVAVQTFIGKLKATVADLEEQLHHGELRHHDHSHEHSHGHDHLHSATDETGQPCCSAGTSDSVMEGISAGSAAFNVHGDHAGEAEEEEFPPLYHSNCGGMEDDLDMAATLKGIASDHKQNGNYKEALEHYTQAIVKAEPSALIYANRADCLLHLNRPRAAIRDCDEALKLNPDSAKALKIRGRARKVLGDWKGARKDLSESQTIDFDDDAVEDLKFVTEKAKEVEVQEAKKRSEDTAEQLKNRSQRSSFTPTVNSMEPDKPEQQQKYQASSSSPPSNSAARSFGADSFPAGGLPSGMSGILGSLMSDPELAAGMKNPKILNAFTELMQSPGGAASLMSNPAKLQKLISDPDVGPFMQKLASKFGPMLGASMSGGMGGLGSMGGMGNHFGSGGDAGTSLLWSTRCYFCCIFVFFWMNNDEQILLCRDFLHFYIIYFEQYLFNR